MNSNAKIVEDLTQKWDVMSPYLDERSRRIWAAVEADRLGWGGVTLVSKATGLRRKTISKGKKEIKDPLKQGDRLRKKGGGRKGKKEVFPNLLEQLEQLVQPHTKGDPMRPLRWSSKSTYKLSEELKLKGYDVSPNTVSNMLKEEGYSLQLNRKDREGSTHKDRDAQFKFINNKVSEFILLGKAAISVDTKKKENIGNYKNGGREYHKKGGAPKVKVHDFKDKELGKVAPYGVYDIAINKGWVSVGISKDTAQFAVNSIRNWWYKMGQALYGQTKEILITADGGGSNSSRSRLWKVELQKLADEIDKTIHISHFPPGTSKWNKIEHKMFCFITQNWRGQPLISRQVVVQLIANTKTKTGLTIEAVLDENDYKTGIKVSDEQLSKVLLSRENFHGEWNYFISPNNKF